MTSQDHICGCGCGRVLAARSAHRLASGGGIELMRSAVVIDRLARQQDAGNYPSDVPIREVADEARRMAQAVIDVAHGTLERGEADEPTIKDTIKIGRASNGALAILESIDPDWVQWWTSAGRPVHGPGTSVETSWLR